MTCPRCQGRNPERQKFCGECGAALGPGVPFAPPAHMVERTLASSSALAGQRKQVTVLFADMAGYTPLAEALGEEAVYQLMRRVYELMIAAVHEHDGTVQELTGDGILALFGAPVALEDAPLRACRAALGIQARLCALEAELAPHGVRPRVRVGINTGGQPRLHAGDAALRRLPGAPGAGARDQARARARHAGHPRPGPPGSRPPGAQPRTGRRSPHAPRRGRARGQPARTRPPAGADSTGAGRDG